MFRNYVLGAGINGLIMGYLLGATVIGTSENNQTKSNFQLGPRILHYDSLAKDLLASLGIKAQPKIFHIGYFDGTTANLQWVKPSLYWRKKYDAKVRGESFKRSIPKRDPVSLVGWDINEIELIGALESKVKIIDHMVDNIDTKQKLIYFSDEEVIIYDNLINTVKLTDFMKLTGIKDYTGLVARSTAFALVESMLLEQLIGGYSYSYFAGNTSYNRITRIGCGKYVVEIPEDNFTQAIAELAEFHLSSFKIVEECQIISPSYVNIYIPNVHMVGRYACWNQRLLINDTIERGVKIAESLCPRH